MCLMCSHVPCCSELLGIATLTMTAKANLPINSLSDSLNLRYEYVLVIINGSWMIDDPYSECLQHLETSRSTSSRGTSDTSRTDIQCSSHPSQLNEHSRSQKQIYYLIERLIFEYSAKAVSRKDSYSSLSCTMILFCHFSKLQWIFRCKSNLGDHHDVISIKYLFNMRPRLEWVAVTMSNELIGIDVSPVERPPEHNFNFRSHWSRLGKLPTVIRLDNGCYILKGSSFDQDLSFHPKIYPSSSICFALSYTPHFDWRVDRVQY